MTSKTCSTRAGTPRPIGRPTKYDPAYCDQIVEFCSGGYSLTAFAGNLGVSRSTINEWAGAHSEFSEALKIAKAAATLALEQDAARIRQEGGAPGSATLVIFGLKNFAPDDWRDRHQHEVSGPDGGPIETAQVSAREIISARLAEIAARKRDAHDQT